MKAMIYEQYGDPDVLQLAERPAPEPAPGEVLVRVRAAAVNPVDWKVLAGYLDELMPAFFPATPGWDVAGVVESVGFDTPEFAPGDEVIAYCRKDHVHDGSFAEYLSVPVRALARKPRNASWEQAAGLPLAGLTALQLLKRLDLSAGDAVLIHAASGGVGAFAAQLAVARGARVVGTASPVNHEFLRSLGVEPVSYGEGVQDRLREVAPEGFSLVADFVGGVLDTTRAVLRPDGRHGSIIDDTVESAGGLYLWTRVSGEELTDLVDLVDSGHLTVPVAQIYPLEEAAEALRANQSGHTRGKIAINVSG
jgi:NADPH:quinone reductase-like Zn-dependent oxidoreductase